MTRLLAGLADFVFSPDRWGRLEELPLGQRLLLSALLLAITIVVALSVGALLGRWAHRRSGSALGQLVDERFGKFRRAVYAFAGLGGAYVALGSVPLPPRVDRYIVGLAYVAAAYAFMRASVHLASLFLLSSVSRVDGENRERLLREYVPLLGKLAALVGWVLFITVVAKHFGRDVSSLVAALGVGSLAIGLAAQQTLGNMIGGFVVLVDRPFRPGDRIRLATGEIGDVLDVGVRSTRIRLLSGNLLIVPNAELANSRVVNLVSHGGEVTVTVRHDADVAKAQAALVELAAADDRVRKEPAPTARVANISDIGVDLAVSFECAVADRSAIEASLRAAILHRFAVEKLPLASRSSQAI